MKKREINYYFDKVKKQINIGQISKIYLLKDGRILKTFDNRAIKIFKSIGYDIEKILLESEKYEINKNIKKPIEILYSNGVFCGYIMEKAKGITLNERNNELTIDDREDLYKYATIHNNLEKIVKESEKIVFPDLLTCDNIFIDSKLNIELIDFDGLQVGNNRVFGVSTSLGNEAELLSSPKYCDQNTKLFSKELDIKSLTHLYFLDTFNIDLNKIGLINPYTGRIVTLDDLFSAIQLDNYDIMHKVWKLFQEKQNNEYLGDDIFEIAEKYNMTAIPTPIDKDIYLKRLKRK